MNVLQRICSNNVEVPVGQVVYTGMLNSQGGYQTDCTVTRLQEKKYDNDSTLFFYPTINNP